ncbi:MAG TPA: hypothetical protein VLR88_09645 [Propionibacteriaceae bacterium]|nr:hypothetical protein [Propionibacteriaceae bacterium]
MSWSRRLAATTVACALLAAGSLNAWAAGTTFTVGDPRVSSAHGLASDSDRDVYWTSNLSGAGRILALNSDGSSAGVVTFPSRTTSVQAVAYRENRVYLGDIGDANSSREFVTVYRLGTLTYGGQSNYNAWDFTYPDGPQDAAAMLVSPRGNIYIVTRGATAAIYRAPSNLSSERPNRLNRVATAPSWVTDGTFLDAQRMALRTYTGVILVDAFTFETVASSILPEQYAGESLTTSPDGLGLMAGSSLPASDVLAVAIPTRLATLPAAPSVAPTSAPPATASATPSGTATASASASTGAEATEAGPRRTGTFLALGAALLLSVAAAAVVALKR